MIKRLLSTLAFALSSISANALVLDSSHGVNNATIRMELDGLAYPVSNIYATVESIAPAQLDAPTSDGYFTYIQSDLALSNISWNAQTQSVDNILSLGGLTITTAAKAFISKGGSLSISDLDIDLNNRVISANINGLNGVGFASHVSLWTFSQMVTSEVDQGGNIDLDYYLGDLAFTETGRQLFINALGLVRIGIGEFALIENVGQIRAKLSIDKHYIAAVPSVPEPSSLVIALSGLMVAAARLFFKRS